MTEHADIRTLLSEAAEGRRITRDELRSILQSEDWTSIVAAGHRARVKRHGDRTASYAAFRVVNYTNFCDIGCTFCSFQDEIDSQRGYVLDLEEIGRKTDEAKEQGCDAIFFQGGVHPGLPLSYYTDAFRLIRSKGMHVRALSPVEVFRLAEKENLPVRDLLLILKEAGLGSVPGAGAEILSDRMRQILSPRKLSWQDWCMVMGECHKLDLLGSCNIVFGSNETVDDVVDHFTYLRDQQDRTGGFLSFVPWVFQPQTKGFPIRHVRSLEYLRMVAAARLFLDNIPHVEVSIMVLGRELAELGLYAGADDISSIVIEENVLVSRGLKTVRAAERYIQEAGFEPRRRSMCYDFLSANS